MVNGARTAQDAVTEWQRLGVECESFLIESNKREKLDFRSALISQLSNRLTRTLSI